MNPLDARAQILLKALIERYIADGQPVGSRSLSRLSGLELSPATVRNAGRSKANATAHTDATHNSERCTARCFERRRRATPCA